MKKLLITAALALATALPAYAQENDPYAQGQRELADQQTQQQINELLQSGYDIYHAAACKVVRQDMSGYRVGDLMRQAVSRSMRTGHMLDPHDLTQQLEHEKEAAAADAAKTDCSYWKQHPEAVSAMRQFMLPYR
jgi:hypothetical protein